MKKIRKCCLLFCVSFFLTGCGEGQGSVTSDPVNSAVSSGEESQSDFTEELVKSSCSSGADE